MYKSLTQDQSFVGQSLPTIDNYFFWVLITLIKAGKRLLGLSKGFSPISPEECNPTGLNYQRFAIFQLSGLLKLISDNIFSISYSHKDSLEINLTLLLIFYSIFV